MRLLWKGAFAFGILGGTISAQTPLTSVRFDTSIASSSGLGLNAVAISHTPGAYASSLTVPRI